MFLLHQCKLISGSLWIALILNDLLIFTSTVQLVVGDEVNLSSIQGDKVNEAIQITSDFLRSEKGVEWLDLTMKSRKVPLMTTDIINEILKTDSLKGKIWNAANVLKEAVKEKSNINSERDKNNVTNDSLEENWNITVTKAENEDNIICLYRKNHNDPEVKKTEDWKKLLEIAPGYTIHSATDKGSKYLICLKKIINVTKMDTTTTDSIIEVASMTSKEHMELEDSSNKNHNVNININTIHRSFKGKNFIDNADVKNTNEEMKINKTSGVNNNENNNNNTSDEAENDCDEDSRENDSVNVDNQNSTCDNCEEFTTQIVETITPIYTEKSIDHEKNINVNQNENIKEPMEVEKLLNKKYHKRMRDRKRHKSNKSGKSTKKRTKVQNKSFKLRNRVKRPKPAFLIPDSRKIEKKNVQPKKFVPLLRNKLKFPSKNLNPDNYQAKTENSFNRRITVIPFIIYLHKIYPLSNNGLLHFVNTEIPLSEIEITTYPLQLLYGFLQNINQPNLVKFLKQVNPSIKSQYFNTLFTSNLQQDMPISMKSQQNVNSLVSSNANAIDMPLQIKIIFRQPEENQDKNCRQSDEGLNNNRNTKINIKDEDDINSNTYRNKKHN